MADRHPEAYQHLLYRAEDGEEEWVWNSRDGIVPTSILLRSGKPAEQVPLPMSGYERHHVPEVGRRIFIDLHPERAAFIASQKVDAFWGHPQFPLSQVYRTKREAIEAIFQQFFADGHQPDLVEVDELLRERFLR